MTSEKIDRLGWAIWEATTALDREEARDVAEHVFRELGFEVEQVVEGPFLIRDDLVFSGGRVYADWWDVTEKYQAMMGALPYRRRYVTPWEDVNGG